jgi:hypothetical protein
MVFLGFGIIVTFAFVVIAWWSTAKCEHGRPGYCSECDIPLDR